MNGLKSGLPVILVDLDGTLFDNHHRTHLAPAQEDWLKPEAWNVYEAAALEDLPVKPMIALVKLLHDSGKVNIAFTTARFAHHFRITMTQLLLQQLLFEHRMEIFMRPVVSVGTQVTPAAFKKSVVFDLRNNGFEVLAAIDDTPDVCSALETQGVATLRARTYCGINAATVEHDNLAEEKGAHRQTKEKLGRSLAQNVSLKTQVQLLETELMAYRSGGSMQPAADTYYQLRYELNLPEHVSLIEAVLKMRDDLQAATDKLEQKQ